MLFTNKQKIPDIDLTLKVDGQVIEYVEHAKCLGITFDTKLTWNKHIDNKIKQAKLYLHQMKTSIARTWGPTPEKMLWIWTTVVRPAITYGSYIWATKLTKAQKDRLNKIQRLALMQLGNFRFTTPEAGLNVALGQIPLDLFLLGTALRTHTRLQHLHIRDWNGKGPGARGKPGHILRAEKHLEEANINTPLIDSLPKTKEWEQEYTVDQDFDGLDCPEGFCLYTDGSKLNENSGFGAVYMQNGDICNEVHGSIGQDATVFQAECYAILHGLDLITAENTGVTVFTDNQSVVHSLSSREMSNKTIAELKTDLNNKCRNQNLQIRTKWIKAHVGHPGNEYADELAKKGTEMRPFGPLPIIPVNKTTIYTQIDKWTQSLWDTRWKNRTDSRQTAIFFPKINLRKSQNIVKLHKNTIDLVVRAITGHDHRNRHTALLLGTGTEKCRFCNLEPETPSHIILTCPRLTQLRTATFKTPLANSIVQSWEVSQLTTFLTVEHIAAMEQED